MATWHFSGATGAPITFTYHPDERGNVSLTVQEVEGLMRTGGWAPGKPPSVKTTSEQFNEYYARLRAMPVPGWETPEDLGRISIEAHQQKMKEA